MENQLFLSLREIYRYLKADPNSRNICEGESLNIGRWTVVGFTEKNSSAIKITGRSIQTSNVSGQPHKIEGCLNVSVDGKVSIANFTCSCKAGSDTCKHIASVLLSCREIESLQQFSTTDIDCYWSEKNRPTGKNEVQPVPLDQFCHFIKCGPPPDLFKSEKVKETFDKEAHELLLGCAEFSIVGQHKKRLSESKAFEERCDKLMHTPKKQRLQAQQSCNSALSQKRDSGLGTLEESINGEVDSSLETELPPPYVTSTPHRSAGILSSSINCSPISVHEVPVVCDESSNFENSVEVSDNVVNLFKYIESNETLNSLPKPSDSSLPPCCLTSYGSLTTSKEMALQICEAEQGSPLWKSKRKFRITGSTSYNIFTAGAHGPCDWDKKVRGIICPPDISYLPGVKHGITKEKEAIDVYCTSTGQTCHSFGLIIPPSQPWLGYSPDGVVFLDGEPVKLLEVKCPLAGKKSNVKDIKLPYLILVNDTYLIKKCHSYYGQIQLGLAILNLPLCDLVIHASWDKSQIVVPVYRNEEFIQTYLNTLHTKYFKYLLHYKCTFIE